MKCAHALHKLRTVSVPLPDEEPLDYSFSIDLAEPVVEQSLAHSSTDGPPLLLLAQHCRVISRLLYPSSPSSLDATSLDQHPWCSFLTPPSSSAAGFESQKQAVGVRKVLQSGIGMAIQREREECLACGRAILHMVRALDDRVYAKRPQVCRLHQLACGGRTTARTVREGVVASSRLLALVEVRQVMLAKRGCGANEVRLDEILVNVRGLSQGELDL
ncbi:hypothetical protein E2562_016987 [Oryza meyeriana var. granulata]|uniref:Uncharacterized protein n=1 Tax=Oryza meyeriana var. granulata TaxID=110450 RepID=A0A6G1ECQ4_9ORYZ|nr:hypothetical protein E2562_016987 [Oryza meyeriana var. granulata]